MNCRSMEEMRKFTFNNEVEKTAFMILKPKKKSKNIEELHTKIKRGTIRRTKEYKYLGEWYNEEYNHKKSIQVRENKAMGMISQIKYYGDTYKVGNMAPQVRMEIFQSTVIPTIFHDVEGWSKISKKDIEELERIQKNVLTAILDMPKTTPYLGLLSELGVWPVEELLDYKRIMLLHQIITSKEGRFLKEVIEGQIKDTFKGCWMEQTKEICSKYSLGIQAIRSLSKYKLKAILKRRISKNLDLKIQEEAKNKTKLRFCRDFNRKLYTKKGSMCHRTVRSIMKTRLNMLELKCNYKGTSSTDTCNLCGVELDTTEHLFSCQEITKNIQTVPDAKILQNDDEKSLDELGNFLKKICKIKGIDMAKTVQENLENIKKSHDMYTIKSVDENGLKLTLTRKRKLGT